MLDTVLKLCQDGIRNVAGALGNEVDAHTLGTDETDDLIDLFDQECRSIVKEQVGLIEEEDHLRLVKITDFRQILIKLAHEPQKECGIKKRLTEKFCGIENIDHAAAVTSGLKEVQNIKCRLREEGVGALIGKKSQISLDRSDSCLGDVSVSQLIVISVVADIGQKETQILQIQKQHSLIVSDTEDHGKNCALYVSQSQHSSKKDRAQLGDGGTHGNAHGAEYIVEGGGVSLIFKVLYAELGDALFHVRIALTCSTDTRHIALNISQEYRYAHIRETLCQNFQCNGFTCTCRTGDETVTICLRGLDEALICGAADPDLIIV